MPLSKLWVIAYRDLGRHRRRSVFTLLAVALGLALLFMMSGLISGMMTESLQNSIRLRTTHLQLRAASYQDDQLSLQSKDLLAEPAALTARATAMSEVEAAAPVLWISGILSTIDESAGLQVIGLDPTSALYAPMKAGLVTGAWLAPDDRDGVLIGRMLAESLNVSAGQKVSLAIVDADGQPDEGVFTVRGLFSTGIPSYDESAVFMTLDKAQAFARTGDHASAIMILLKDEATTDKVAAAFKGGDFTVLTWTDLNKFFVETMSLASSFYVLMYGIVILIVAVIIANTLLMAVFERVREMGILAALGMKGGQIRQMFLLEGASLGLAGVAVGAVLGLASVAYLAETGIPLSDKTAVVAGSAFALGTTMRAAFDWGAFAYLSIATLIVVILASLYPAWYAARLEPVDALRD